MTTKRQQQADPEQEPTTAPDPTRPATPTQANDDDAGGRAVNQTAPYPGRIVKFVSRDQFIAAAHTGEADYSPAIIARVLPTKGPDDNPLKVDLVVIDPERESGSYVERDVVPFDGTGAGYAPLNQPVAVSFSVDALRPIVGLLMEDYMAQRVKDEARYDEESIKELVSQEVQRVIAADRGAKTKGKE